MLRTHVLLPAALCAFAAMPVAAEPGAGTLVSIAGGAVQRGDSCGKADFTLRAERPLTLVQRTTIDGSGEPTYSTSSTMKRGDTLNISACTYDGALEICATPDGGGKEYCWRPLNSRYALTAAPGFALAARQPPLTPPRCKATGTTRSAGAAT